MLLEKTSPTISSNFRGSDLPIGVIKQKQCVKHTIMISQEPVLLQAPENNIFMQGIVEGVPSSLLVVSKGDYLPKAKEKPRVKGNRCGHDPKNMRFFKQPPNQARRFHVLEEAQRRVKSAYAKPFDYPRFHGLLFHRDEAGEESRRRRSERVESSFLLVMPALFNGVNLVKMEVGHFNGTEFIHYDYGYLVKVTKANYSRIKEAMLVLQEEGLVEVKLVVKTRADGSMRTARVVMTLTEKMFAVVGLSEPLQIDRQRALLAHAKKEKQAEQRKTYLALFKPQPSQAQQKKQAVAISSVKELATHFKIVKKPPKTLSSSPLSHPSVRALTHTLFLSGGYPTLLSAATEACQRLNKPPPLNSS
jgi:hypothetical protein